MISAPKCLITLTCHVSSIPNSMLLINSASTTNCCTFSGQNPAQGKLTCSLWSISWNGALSQTNQLPETCCFLSLPHILQHLLNHQGTYSTKVRFQTWFMHAFTTIANMPMNYAVSSFIQQQNEHLDGMWCADVLFSWIWPKVHNSFPIHVRGQMLLEFHSILESSTRTWTTLFYFYILLPFVHIFVLPNSAVYLP